MANEKNTYSREDLLVAGWHKLLFLSALIFFGFVALYCVVLTGSTHELFPVSEGFLFFSFRAMVLSGGVMLTLWIPVDRLVARSLPIWSITDATIRMRFEKLDEGLAEAESKIAELQARVAKLERK